MVRRETFKLTYGAPTTNGKFQKHFIRPSGPRYSGRIPNHYIWMDKAYFATDTGSKNIDRLAMAWMEVERCHVAYLCCTFWTLSQRAIFCYLTKQYPRFNSHWMNNRQLYYHVQGKRILGPNTYKAISLLTVNSYERSLNYNKHLIAQRSSKIMWFMVRIKSKL